MIRTFKTRVMDKAGTLNRLTSLFVRRQFNIITLSAIPTKDAGVSEITFVVEVDDADTLRNLTLQLQKQINVLEVEDITDINTYNRELVLFKIPNDKRDTQLQSIFDSYNGAVTILKKDGPFTYVQATGPHYTMENLLDDLSDYDVTHLSRTGSVGIV